MVCLVALVESSTTNVDLVLRESTLALTTTLSNSVIWLLGIFSVNSRSRSAVGFHSTNAALTSYTTSAPPRWRLQGSRPTGCGDTERSAAGLCTPGSPKLARTCGIDLGSVPRTAWIKYRAYPAPRPISLPRSRGACGRLRGVTGLEVVARRDQDDLGPSARTCST